jgi:3-oxoacyl-[acyl-carrier protein] reductase
MDLKLQDRVALVAGASKGLGAATARQLAREGARVAIMARDAGRLEETARAMRAETGAQVLAAPGDVTVTADIDRVIGETTAQFGGLDILVTNSGGPPAGGFDDFDDEGWHKAINLQFMSVVRLIRAGLPHLRRSDAPAVLTITSISVKQPISNLILSNSIRMAVIGLTKSLALDLGAAGVRCNSILPSFTRTDRVQTLIQDRAQRAGTTFEEEMEKSAAEAALARMAEPDEFANVAAFLCSPAASYLTGVMLNFDGGLYRAVY